ncbi:MAG: succinylglutamate desuccinylase/aspartoacylase family protein [Acidobacteriota bacterium]
MDELIIAGQRMEPGSRQVVKLPVTQDICMSVDIYAHVVAGRSEGPTLLLLSMLHGNEWFSVLILRELLRRIDPLRLAGNVIAVPVANPSALMTGSRCILDDSDEPDANRTFGGIYEWTTNQITRVIEKELFPGTDYLIDYHVSDWGSTMADVSYTADHSNADVTEKSRAMAVAYGFPVLHALRIFSGLRGPRTSLGYAGEKFKIPGIVAGVGGLGFGEAREADWLKENVEGTLGVMKQLHMVEGTPKYCERYLRIDDYWRVSPRVGGYLEPVVGLDRQFTEVAQGELLARVTSPTSFEIIEELLSPGRGTIFYTCRPYMVRPGAWAFGVADAERSEWMSVSREPTR